MDNANDNKEYRVEHSRTMSADEKIQKGRDFLDKVLVECERLRKERLAHEARKPVVQLSAFRKD